MVSVIESPVSPKVGWDTAPTGTPTPTVPGPKSSKPKASKPKAKDARSRKKFSKPVKKAAKASTGKRKGGPRAETVELANALLTAHVKCGAKAKVEYVSKEFRKATRQTEDKFQRILRKYIYEFKYCTWEQHEDYSEEITLTATGRAAYKELKK